MSGISSIPSSLYSVLTDYYTRSWSTRETVELADDTTTDTTETPTTLDQEEVTSISFSLNQGLVDVLSSMLGTDTEDDSDDDWFYNALGLQQGSDVINAALRAYFNVSDTGATTGSSIDVTA